MLSPRVLLDEIGPFNEEMLRLEDWEYLLRCTLCWPIPVLGEDLAVIDIRHRDSGQYERTRNAANVLQEAFPVGATWFERRQFRSYVRREVAASAYNDGRYTLAVRHFARALIIFPWMRVSQLRRLIRSRDNGYLKI